MSSHRENWMSQVVINGQIETWFFSTKRDALKHNGRMLSLGYTVIGVRKINV